MTLQQARIYDALRWVAQEARAVKMTGTPLPKGCRLREALDELERVQGLPEEDPPPTG